MSYCGTYSGTAIIKAYSGIEYKQLGFSTNELYGSFLLGTLIPQAQKILDVYCNHDFCDHPAGTITVDGTGKDYVIIPPAYSPLRGTLLNSVTIDSVSKTVSDFKIYDQYVVYDGGTFPKDPLNVVLVGTYGYSSVPGDVSYIHAQVCANALREMVRSKMMPDLIVPLMEAEGASSLGAILASPRIFTSELKGMLKNYVYVDVGVG